MKQFMLFLREDLDEIRNTPEKESQRQIEIMVGWVEQLSKSGSFVSGEPLEPEYRIARKDEIIYDGPFIETKEAVSGYLIINAESLEQACEIAQGCPLIGMVVKSIEVRPVLKY